MDWFIPKTSLAMREYLQTTKRLLPTRGTIVMHSESLSPDARSRLAFTASQAPADEFGPRNTTCVVINSAAATPCSVITGRPEKDSKFQLVRRLLARMPFEGMRAKAEPWQTRSFISGRSACSLAPPPTQ